jgi:hypothetical protein
MGSAPSELLRAGQTEQSRRVPKDGQFDAFGSAGIWLTRIALSLAASDRVLLAKSGKSD